MKLINKIRTELKAVLAHSQNDGSISTFKEDFKANIHYLTKSWDFIKNNSINGYLAYNSHIREIGKGRDKQLVFSDQLSYKLIEVMVNNKLERTSITGICDFLSPKIFDMAIKDGSCVVEEYQAKYEEIEKYFKTKALNDKLQAKLLTHQLQVKKVNKV